MAYTVLQYHGQNTKVDKERKGKAFYMTAQVSELHLGKSGCGHLNPALVRSVDLQVMSICAVQTQQATARKTCIVTYGIHSHSKTVNIQLHGEFIYMIAVMKQ